MPSWPFTTLHIGTRHNIIIAGPFIHVVNSETGQISHTVRGDVVVTNSAIDEKFDHLVTIGDDKKLRVWDIATLQPESTRELPKKVTQVSFVQNEVGTSIVVADKFGDVFSYPLIPRATTDTKTSGRESLASHENPHGDLILGHASIITCFTFSTDGKYIVTADRDEHIRASWFPRGYIIERYCLGHQQFVSAINIPSFNPSVLISGGGDPYLSIWDWKTGEEKCQIQILEAIKPYIKGTPTRTKWQKKKNQRTTKRRRNKKEKELEEEMEVELSVDVQPESPNDGDKEEAEPPDNDVILAVKKIVTLQIEEHNQWIVFSAIGGSALCYCRFTEDPESSPDVRLLDLYKPILDFEPTLDNRILVIVDSNWSLPDVLEETKPAFMVEFNGNEFQLSSEPSPLIETLNGPALQQASSHEVAAMRLYEELELLPKRPDGPEDDEINNETSSRPSTPTPSVSALTGKMAARLKKQSHIRQKGPGGASKGSREATKKIRLAED